MDWNTQIEGEGTHCTVKELVKELYQKAGKSRSWNLVRHTAGLLGKKPDDLDKCVLDLLVRQKQIGVGNPSEAKEKFIDRYPFLTDNSISFLLVLPYFTGALGSGEFGACPKWEMARIFRKIGKSLSFQL